MVGIFVGAGAGFTRGSGNLLGGAGVLGSAVLGRGGENVSLNAANGNLLVTQQDEFLAGRGLDAGISRTYNSLAQTTDGDNNDQWQMGTVRRLANLTGTLNTAGSTIQRLGGDGALVTYSYGTRDGVAAYWTTDGEGAHDKLVKTGSTWVWTEGTSQVTETYAEYPAGSGSWRITAQTDTDNYSLTFSYVGDLLDKVTTANGEWVQYQWSGTNLSQIVTGYTDLATATAKTLTRTRYGYDGTNRLTSVLVDLSPGDNSIADNKYYATYYSYVGATKQIQTITQSDGSRIDLTYDGSGRVSTLTQSVATGDTRVTSLVYGAGYTTVTGPDGQVTQLDYDGAQRLTKITAPPAFSGAAAQVVQFAWDADGNLTSATDAAGKITSYTYDADGNQLTTTDPNNNVVTRTYGARNQLLTETRTGSNAAGAAVAQTTRYVYDVENHLRFVISAEGHVVRNDYDAYGQLYWRVEFPQSRYDLTGLTSSQAPTEAQMIAWTETVAGPSAANRKSVKIIHSDFDARGNITVARQHAIADDWAHTNFNEGYQVDYFTYDQSGRLLSRNKAGETAETFVYDGLGRMTASTDTTGGTTTFVFNDGALTTTVTTAAGFTTVQSFNKAGEVVGEARSGNFDPNGSTSYLYDKNGRMRVAIDATGYKNFFLYDKAGRKVADVNAYGHVTEYRYDAANRVIATTAYYNILSAANLAALDNPNNSLEMAAIRPAASTGDIWSWQVHDAGGRVVQSIDGDGGVTAFEYDASNRLVKTTSYFNKVAVAGLKTTPPLAVVAVTAHTKDTVNRTFYDGDGRLIGVLDGEGYLSEIIYDKAGQKVEEVAYATKTNAGHWASGSFDQLRSTAAPTAAANRRIRYVVDAQGVVRYMIDSAGAVTAYSYNTAGKVTQTRVHAAPISTSDFTYLNVKSLVVANATNDRLSTISYNAQGLVASTVDASGLTTSFVYDSSGRVTKATAGSGGSARTTYHYYTAAGDLRFTVDAEGFVTRFDYDAEGRKTREVIWDNPISVTDATTIAQVNSLAAGAWTDIRYEYDAAGRVSSSYDGMGVRTHYTYYGTGKLAGIYHAYGTNDLSLTYHGYDGAGRLVSEYFGHGEPEQAVVTYAYDGLGNQTSVTDARGKVTSYSYDEAGRVLTTTDAAGGVTSYVYNAFGEVTQTTDARGGVTSNIYNNLGQLTRTTDAASIATDYSYTAFGEVANLTRAGATTSFQYNKLGQITRTTDALGGYEAYTYDAHGNRITSRNKLGGTTTYAYDRRGLLTSQTVPVGSYNNAGTLVASSVTTTFAYDARGNRKQMVEAAGLAEAQTTSFVYDKANRLIETIGPTFFNTMTPRSYIYYDARGNVTSMVDPAGARTVNYYDDLNRVVVTIDAVGTYTSNSYDKNGNITATCVYATAVAIPSDGGSEEEAPAAPAGASRVVNYSYDNLDRMLTSSVAGVNSYIASGASYALLATTLHTAYEYDAAGNVVKTTDANGNPSYSYYDLLGRRTVQIDGEGYRTDWTYDAEGNVTSERRYWNKAAAPSGTATPPAVTADAARDRITNFTYDLNGNRLSEARTGVEVHNGSGGTSVVTATIHYLYNALGQVTRKTEATGDQINYSYDLGGRLTTEARQAFVDQSGTSVTPTVDYYYDGVGNLTRTRQRGSANAAERVTTYGYSGSMLHWMSDAEVQDGDVKNGLTTYYHYDMAGRQTYTYYARYDSAGSLTKTAAGLAASYEGVLTAYDAAGRATQQWQATYDTTNGWIDKGPRAVTSYDAYGQVVSVAVGGVTQQQNQYDAGGRLIATNSGDGVWRHFGYDGNGNQTIAIQSAGADLTGKTFAQALAMIGQADVAPTFTAYDKRNMGVTVTETGRQLTIGGAAQTLVTTRSFNAFGEVASETNALNATINYTYNNMGRLIKSESPTVSITLENGTTANVRPTELFYYDAGGRLVATRDANNNLTRLQLLAGSGYGGGEALVTVRTAADGGVKQIKYDIHGDARELVGELGHRTLQTFDAKGRITVRQEMRNAANANDDFIDYYAYDGLGQQLKHWNNALQTPIYGDPVWVEDPYYPPYGPPYYYEPEIPPEGGNGHWETPVIGYTPDVETTDYDIQGRVIAQRAFGGDVTTTSYVWEAGMATTGIGTFGGWSQTTTMANGLYSVQKTDLFGRATYKRDLGAHVTSYDYDVAGRMTSSALGGLTTTFTWLSSGFLGRMATGSANAGSQSASWTRDTATYSYDQVGNRLTEQLAKEAGYYTPGYMYYHNPYEPDWMPESYYETSELVKNATATYDALGRLRSWTEAGTAKSPASSIANEYDAAGNVRRTLSSYRTLDANGTASSTAMTRDYWFRYDSMNRVVVNQGSLTNGVIGRGISTYGMTGTGQDIAYNIAGQRTSIATTNAYFDGYGGYSANEVKELYVYDDAGRLIETREATGTIVAGTYGGDPVVPAATGTGVRRSSYYYDLMGRQTLQQDYQANGTTVVFSRSAVYNEKGQLTSDYTSNLKTDNKTYTSSTSFNYGYGAGYMLGAVVSQSSSNGVTGQSTTYSSTTNSYIWYDGALQSTISYKPNTSQSTTYTTSFAYNGMGQLVSAYISDGKPHSVAFTNDELGQIIRRDETAVSGQTGAPHEVWYRFAGRQLGYTGNNGTSDMSMAASIEDRRVVSPTNQGTFRNKQMYGASYADFAQNYDPINSFSQGSAGGSYSVQRGDTLQSIAQSVWGDSSLWYKIAEANGLSAASGLIEGQRLTLPTGVLRSTNNASTLTPYDPGEAVGDLSPTTAPKPKNNSKKCGGFGMILIAVIAIAVTVVTSGAALAALSSSVHSIGAGIATILGTSGAVSGVAAGAFVAAGAIGGAVGSIVSQGIGVATGIQDKFSWKGVAMGAISGAIGGAVGANGMFGESGLFGKGILAAAGRGVVSSAVSQGVGVATGLQSKFDWAGVAAAGVGAGVASFVGGKTGSLGGFGSSLAANTASGIANAATRSLIEGSSFGDNLLAALPDIIGGTLGNALAAEFAGALQQRTFERGVGTSVEILLSNDTIAAADIDLADLATTGEQLVRIDLANNDPIGTAAQRVVDNPDGPGATIRYAEAAKMQRETPTRVAAGGNAYAPSNSDQPPPSRSASASASQLEIEEIVVYAPRRGSVEWYASSAAGMIGIAAGLDDDQTRQILEPFYDSLDAARGTGQPAGPAFGSFGVDQVIIATGSTINRINDALNSSRWARWTLEAASFAAGPAKYVIGEILGEVTAPLIGAVAEASAERAVSTGYDANTALAIGTGVVAISAAAIGLATGGVRRFQSLFRAGKDVLRTIGPRIRNLVGMRPRMAPYRSNGGHHPATGAAFRGDADYKYRGALTISDAELARFGVRHRDITSAQQTRYARFRRSGGTLTWESLREIEIGSMVDAGMGRRSATRAVDAAIRQLQESGVQGPTRIPWSRQ